MFFKAEFRNCLFALYNNHVSQDRSDILCNVNFKYCQNRQHTRKQLLFWVHTFKCTHTEIKKASFHSVMFMIKYIDEEREHLKKHFVVWNKVIFYYLAVDLLMYIYMRLCIQECRIFLKRLFNKFKPRL